MTLVHAEHHGSILHVQMSSPPVNAFSNEFFDSLQAALLDTRPETATVLVSSSVERIFAAGGDLPFMARADEATSTSYVRRCQEIYALLERPEHVSIVAIDGACVGGGLEFSLAADIRIASPASRLGLPEISLGILAGAGAIHRVVRAIGQGPARDLLLTGEPISATQAHDWGLVTRLSEDPVGAGLALAHKVGVYSPEAIAATLDIVELNEAFASQAVAVVRDAKLDPATVNPYGGAIALGHPVGATGAILTLRVAKHLARTDGELGVVTMCIGGGQALAALFRRWS